MEDTAFRLLCDGLRAVPARLCVSEVVLDEVKNNFRKELELETQRGLKSAERLAKLLGERTHRRGSPVDVTTATNEYAAFLRAKLDRLGALIVPYPTISHESVVAHALSGRKPFTSDGRRGYRDFLIWENLKAVARQSEQEVAFVTGNVKDFFDGDALHPDLQADCDVSGRIMVFSSLGAFNDKFLIVSVQQMKGVQGRIQDAGINAFDVEEWFSTRFQHLLHSEDVVAAVVGSRVFDRVRTESVNRLNRVECSVRETRTNAKILRLVFDASISVQLETPPLEDVFGPMNILKQFGISSWYGVTRICDLTTTVDLLIENSHVIAEQMIAIKSADGRWARRVDIDDVDNLGLQPEEDR